jgi:hypothetical protein
MPKTRALKKAFTLPPAAIIELLAVSQKDGNYATAITGGAKGRNKSTAKSLPGVSARGGVEQ